jgi:hypothetical protein
MLFIPGAMSNNKRAGVVVEGWGSSGDTSGQGREIVVLAGGFDGLCNRSLPVVMIIYGHTYKTSANLYCSPRFAIYKADRNTYLPTMRNE